MASKKHTELIRAWLDGAKIQFKDFDGRWHDCYEDVIDFRFDMEYRIKPTESERVYPVTLLSKDELERVYWSDKEDGIDSRRNLINFALKAACDAGQIVTREEFDRAVGDRKKRDSEIATKVAQHIADKCRISFEFCDKAFLKNLG